MNALMEFSAYQFEIMKSDDRAFPLPTFTLLLLSCHKSTHPAAIKLRPPPGGKALCAAQQFFECKINAVDFTIVPYFTRNSK